jgi:hypothetical protein
MHAMPRIYLSYGLAKHIPGGVIIFSGKARRLQRMDISTRSKV